MDRNDHFRLSGEKLKYLGLQFWFVIMVERFVDVENSGENTKYQGVER